MRKLFLKCRLMNFPLGPLGCFSFAFSFLWQPCLQEKKKSSPEAKIGKKADGKRSPNRPEEEGERLCCFLGSESHGGEDELETPSQGREVGQETPEQKAGSRRRPHAGITPQPTPVGRIRNGWACRLSGPEALVRPPLPPGPRFPAGG